MNLIVMAIVLVVVIALICSVMLVIASTLMAVKEDERFPAIRECLPGANCGACGYAGCDAYAKALVAGDEARPNLCVPGGAAAANAMASLLGVEAGSVEERVAVVCCGGDCTKTESGMDYQGARSCKAAKLIFGGAGACAYGCLGNGDCVAVCPEHAITIDKGVAVIDREACIGCGLCASTCPKDVIAILPKRQVVYDRCSNPERGKAVMDVCKVGCIGCTKCKQVCPSDAITMEGTLAQVDPTKCTACGTCVASCPTKCMTLVTK
ncbi:MAG: RnfABCDGE type electron transport complex subunit B [Pseudoflavonifractor sp.]